MRIASKERTPGRTHQAAGKNWTFNPEPGTEAPMLCEVDDPAALAVFLHPRNSNTFYAPDPPDVTLTRPTALAPVAKPAPPAFDAEAFLDQTAVHVIAAVEKIDATLLPALRAAEQGGKNRKTVIAAIDARTSGSGDVADQAGFLVKNDTAIVLQLLDSITDPAILAEVVKQELAGENRDAVLEKAKQKIG